MALTTEEVRKIASLARLRFAPEEEAAIAGQLGKIVDYIDQLQRLDAGKPAAATPEAPPVPPPRAAPEAEDVPRPCLPREIFLANAPAAKDGFLLVPEVRTTSKPDAPSGNAGRMSDDLPV